MDGMAEWQSRPLDAVYPVIFIDAIHVKIRNGAVANRPLYVALAVTAEGRRDILGLWAGDGSEGAMHWMHILTEIKNRSVTDVLMLVCDGLKGLPDAVETVWPRTTVQITTTTCRSTAIFDTDSHRPGDPEKLRLVALPRCRRQSRRVGPSADRAGSLDNDPQTHRRPR